MWARLCECTGAEAHDLTFDGRDARLKNCGAVGLWLGAETDGGQGAGEGGWGGDDDICWLGNSVALLTMNSMN